MGAIVLEAQARWRVIFEAGRVGHLPGEGVSKPAPSPAARVRHP